MKVARAAAVMVLAVFVSGCENAAAPFIVDDQDHAISLIREQRYFWDDEVEQALVVSRLPRCQRRFPILPGRADSVVIEVFEAGDRLWALRQGRSWYLVSTEKCLVQPWAEPTDTPPGREVGSFTRKDGELAFVPAAGSPAAR